MATARRSVLRIGALSTTAALLAGCTSFADEPTGRELVSDAIEALEETGSFSAEVRHEITDLSGFDVHIQEDGAIGTVAMGGDHDAPFVLVDGRLHLVPPPAFYTDWMSMSEEEAAPFIGRYLPNQEAANLPVTREYLVEELLPSPDEVAEEVESTSVDGRPVFVVTADDGRRLAVTASRPHLPVLLVVPADESDGPGAPDGAVAFSRFGERETITPPPDPITAAELDG